MQVYFSMNKLKYFYYLSFPATDEAGIFDNFLFIILFSSQISECVNDDTKDEIENNNDDHEEEKHVVN